eukprot:2281951-Pleurochrysis_carterae.AAC.3
MEEPKHEIGERIRPAMKVMAGVRSSRQKACARQAKPGRSAEKKRSGRQICNERTAGEHREGARGPKYGFERSASGRSGAFSMTCG